MVYYNPEKPEKAFVERYAGLDRIFRLLIIIFSIVGFVLIANSSRNFLFKLMLI